MFRYHIPYVLQVPAGVGEHRYYFGDMTVERRDPVTTDERIAHVKAEVALRQPYLPGIACGEWITLLNIIELASRP